jgi:integrase
MASVHKRPDSKFWHAAFRMADGTPGGRLILRSTKCTDRQKALAAAMEYERAAKLAGAGNLVEAQAREIIADLMKRSGTDEMLRAPTVKDFLNQWLTTKKVRKSAATHTRYAGAVKGFLTTLGERASKPLTALTPRDVERYLQARTGEKLSPSTVGLSVKVIRTALNHARRQGVITTNPAEAIELPEAQSVERGTFTAAEVKMLVDTAKGDWKTMILLAYYTGARLGDCCRMQWTDVDLSAGAIIYKQSKTGQKVTVPVHADLLAHLNKLAGTDKPEVFIMPEMASVRTGGRDGLSQTFIRIMRKAGLDAGAVEKVGARQLSRRTFHALRHSFTSALANAGVAPEVRMKLTGHKTESSHRAYTHHELTPLRAAVDKIPSLG